ncbi:MAG: alpha/beta hydrolase [Spongiibacteraceae bacterium]|nr:alpha/beta hydrolase [Spongiibacteraceae bacterium]
MNKFVILSIFFSTVCQAEDVKSVKSFDLPSSALRTDQSKKIQAEHLKIMIRDARFSSKCGNLRVIGPVAAPTARKCLTEAFYKTGNYKELVKKFPVTIETKIIENVYTEIFTPKDGVADENKHRILISLHNGGFRAGGKHYGRAEGIPISSVGKIKVIAVDYRKWPEHYFPAASEDVATVYKDLLKSYRPENIGIYGCSAGAQLTGQSVAWFLKEKLPLPGAIMMACFAASKWEGDSKYISGAIDGVDNSKKTMPYFNTADWNDPLVTPASSDEILSQFPPSLLITGTRDPMMSSVIHSHQELTRLGVEADLHVWEGMVHGFFIWFYNLPESAEVFNITTKFFHKHLGKSQK